MSDSNIGCTHFDLRKFRPNFRPPILAFAIASTAIIAPAAEAEEWQKSVTMYGLIPWLDIGVVADSGHSTTTSVDPGDIIDALDFTLMTAGEFRKGNTSLLFDLIYTDLGSGGTLTGPTAGSISVDTKMVIAAAAVGRDIFHDDSQMAQVFGGIRYVSMDTSISALGGGPVGAGVDADIKKDYFEPLIGIRGSKKINDRMSLVGNGNIGGFGVGSELTLDVYGGLQYAFSERWVGNLGFRYISIDYSASNGDIDMDMYGPVFGMTMKF